MKKMIQSLLFCFSVLSFAQTIPDSVITFAETKVQEYAKDYPGVSVSIVKGENIAWNKVLGFRDLEGNVPVTSDTKFNIYSTSKFITGLAYLHLVKTNGSELLDRKITEIDPNLPKSWNEITVRNLLNHTSGIRHYRGRKDWIGFSNLRCESPRDAMDCFIDAPLKAKVGGKQIYTTYGMVVASHVLEELTGMSYEQAVNELVFFDTPLVLDGDTVDKATPYIKTGSGFKGIEALNAICKYGGGGFIASSDQLVQAGQHLFDGSIMPLTEIKKIYAAEYPEGKTNGIVFAMGSGISESLGLYANMGGASPGGRSYVLVLADQQVAVAITTNCEGPGEKAYELASGLAKKFAGIN